MNNTALPVKTLSFSFALPERWLDDSLSVACRLRGSLGLSLAKQCCFYDAQHTQCEGCDKRPHCHYGQTFKTPQNVQLEDNLKVGCLPHTWALEVEQSGQLWIAKIYLAGIAVAHAASWNAAIDKLPFAVIWNPESWWAGQFRHEWKSATPLGLKFRGKRPKNKREIEQAIVKSLVSKSKMLASMHHLDLPNTFIDAPFCSSHAWCEPKSFECGKRTGKDVAGWMVSVAWAEDTPLDWLPWLNLAFVLGVGRQTTFGLGRFVGK